MAAMISAAFPRGMRRGMTFGAKRRSTYCESDHRRLPPGALPQRVFGGAAAIFVAALSAWTVCDFVAPAGRGDRLAMVSRRGDRLAVAKPDSAWSYYALLFDPHLSSPTLASFTDD